MFRLIDAEKTNYIITKMISLLDVSRSGYYKWAAAKGAAPSPAVVRCAALDVKVAAFHKASDEVYGSPRILAGLARRSTILICDERAVTGRVLAEQLAASGSSLHVFSTVRDAAAVVDAFTAHPTDVVLIGIRRGDPSGPQAVDALLTEHPTAPVIVFGAAADTSLLARSIRRGAQGCMVWDIRQPANRRAIFSRAAATIVPPPTAAPKALTETELRVLHGMGLGQTNRQISRTLSLSEGIVTSKSRRIISKLGARDRAHAVALALRFGLLT